MKLMLVLSLLALGCVKKVETGEGRKLNAQGVKLLDQDKPQEAADAFGRALKADPRYTKARINLGIALYRAGQLGRAEEVLKGVMDEVRDKRKVMYVLGLVYRTQGRYPEAAELFEKVVGLDPQDHYSYYNLGVLYDKMGRTEDAVRAFRKVVELAPRNTAAHYNLGRLLLKLGRKEEAERELGTFRKLQGEVADTSEGYASGYASGYAASYLEQSRYATPER